VGVREGQGCHWAGRGDGPPKSSHASSTCGPRPQTRLEGLANRPFSFSLVRSRLLPDAGSNDALSGAANEAMDIELLLAHLHLIASRQTMYKSHPHREPFMLRTNGKASVRLSKCCPKRLELTVKRSLDS
jgi:hypothetical protein